MVKRQIIVLEKGVKATDGPMKSCCSVAFIPFRG